MQVENKYGRYMVHTLHNWNEKFKQQFFIALISHAPGFCLKSMQPAITLKVESIRTYITEDHAQAPEPKAKVKNKIIIGTVSIKIAHVINTACPAYAIVLQIFRTCRNTFKS